MESALPPELGVNVPVLVEPEAILSSREITKQGEKITEWLILWKDKPVEEATWEKAVDIKTQFPNFCLEDKATLSGGGIDRNWEVEEVREAQEAHERPKELKVYSRRPRAKN